MFIFLWKVLYKQNVSEVSVADIKLLKSLWTWLSKEWEKDPHASLSLLTVTPSSSLKLIQIYCSMFVSAAQLNDFFHVSVTARGANGNRQRGFCWTQREGKLHLVIVKYLQNQYFRAVWLVDVHCTFDKQIRLHRLTCTKVWLCFTDRKALPEAPTLWLYKLSDNYILNCTYCTCHFVMITTKNNTTLGLTWIYCN